MFVFAQKAAGTVVSLLISMPVLGQREEAVDLAANDESGDTELLLASNQEDVKTPSESLVTVSLLKRLKGDQQQQAAADLLLHRQRDLLLMMPTGSGKTMLLLLYALGMIFALVIENCHFCASAFSRWC